jgi:hypothetical protein
LLPLLLLLLLLPHTPCVRACRSDDVRHIRNRRGWMAYHIAIHKNFEHLAELLHPDIP